MSLKFSFWRLNLCVKWKFPKVPCQSVKTWAHESETVKETTCFTNVKVVYFSMLFRMPLISFCLSSPFLFLYLYLLVIWLNLLHDEMAVTTSQLMKRQLVSSHFQFHHNKRHEPMIFAIPMQRSTNSANKPTESWLLCWFQINPWSGE